RTTPEEILGKELTSLDHRISGTGLWTRIVTAIDAQEPRQHRIELDAAPGPGTFEITITPYGDDRAVLEARDLSEAIRGERLLAAAYEDAARVRATLQTALDATTDAFAVYSVELGTGLIPSALPLLMINAAGAAPIGDPDDLVGRDLRDFYPAAQESGLWDAILDALANQVTCTVRVHDHDPDGVWVASWDNRITPVGTEQVVITWRDVTDDERRQRSLTAAHEQAQHAATHDPLTGLANRALFTEQLAAALDRDDGGWVAVVYLDLDGFKDINDTHGHAAGDAVLRAVAERLERAIRASDTVTRLGGDEFCVLVRTTPEQWDEAGFIHRIQDAVEHPLDVDGVTVLPQTSVGVAVSPPGPPDADELVRTADARMYRNKTARHAARGGAGATPAGVPVPRDGPPVPEPRTPQAGTSSRIEGLHEDRPQRR
ncbi:MAG: GGDEF domain-containing protein, partial [Kineosporiaceae bacterium]